MTVVTANAPTYIVEAENLGRRRRLDPPPRGCVPPPGDWFVDVTTAHSYRQTLVPVVPGDPPRKGRAATPTGTPRTAPPTSPAAGLMIRQHLAFHSRTADGSVTDEGLTPHSDVLFALRLTARPAEMTHPERAFTTHIDQ